LGVHALADLVRGGRLRADVVLGAAFDAIERGRAGGLNAFVAAHDGPRAALAAAGRAGGAIAEGRKKARGKGGGPLAGVPVAVGDDVADLVLPTTAGSRVLAGYVSPYEATAVARLLDAGAVVVGKTNVDEFGMGWGTETSAYGPTANPAARAHTPGGSAGGAAAAVASGAVRAALGADAGGGLRQAAAACGVVGVRPTYGRVSRSGLVGATSSLEQVGVCARSVDDAAAVLEVIAGRDPRDATTADLEVDRLRPPGGPFEDGRPLRGVRVGRPKEYFGDDVAPAVRAAVDAAIALARDLGAHVEEVALEHAELAPAAYHAIAAVEAASSLARYDGVRFGAASAPGGARAVYDAARGGFGPEVVRRVALGTHLLSRADRDGHYRRAQDARARIARDLADALGDVDLLVTPTTPAPAPPPADVPSAAFRQDAFTVGPSLAGLPAVTIPVARVGGVPVGMQLVGRHFGEPLLLRAAAALERALGPEARA
jgi:aspartyl-tRNA(Asn)/glutamyl-tRNA(Gln) amidotransferase subunit A